MKSTKVMVWLGKSPKAVEAGEFSWNPEKKIGYFSYSPEYLGMPERFALDPIALPLKRTQFHEVLQRGIFGAFRDSGPDSWGRGLLMRRHGELDDFDYLLLAGSDGVGAISVGEVKDLDYLELSDIEEADIDISTDIVIENEALQAAIKPTTSLGGAKPKLTVKHKGQLWIAKFPERGDSPYLPHNEHIMLTLAKECGIPTPDSFVHPLKDDRSVLLVKRFDREAVVGGYARSPYVSAHTVLNMDGNAGTDTGKKSYLIFNDAVRRWPGIKREEFARDLWHRIVFNALISNVDDHARNHGLLFDTSTREWGLSPAFDMVASIGTGPVSLSLMFHPEGALANHETLLISAKYFGIAKDEALDTLQGMAKTIIVRGEALFYEYKVDKEYVERIKPAFRLASEIYVPI